LILAMMGSLAGCLPPPATGEMHAVPAADPSVPLNSEIQSAKKAQEAAMNVGNMKSVPATGPVHNVSLGDIHMRAVAQRLDEISLWRADDAAAANSDIWDGVEAQDVPVILPGLIGAKNEQVKKITLRIAMSAVYTPAGMDAIDYVRWRARVLAAQEKYTEAARLLNVARIGRDSNADLMLRIIYELASDQAESACLESMAAGHVDDMPFWQGMEVLCAHQAGDIVAVEKLRAALPDGEIKTAAAKLDAKGADAKPFIAALVNTSGVLHDVRPIADNADILAGLKHLNADIKNADDTAAAVKQHQGELLLLSLGALAAEHHAEETQSTVHQVLEWLKQN